MSITHSTSTPIRFGYGVDAAGTAPLPAPLPAAAGLSPEVGRLLRFTPADLVHCRQGRLGDAQRAGLQAADDRRQRTLRVVAYGMAAVPVLAAAAGTVVWLRGGPAAAVGATWPMAVVFAVLAVALVRSNPPQPPSGSVAAVRGTTNLVKVVREVKRRDHSTGFVRTHLVTHHELSVADRTFTVPAELATVLPQGTPVVAYVAGGVLVGLEATGPVA